MPAQRRVVPGLPVQQESPTRQASRQVWPWRFRALEPLALPGLPGLLERGLTMVTASPLTGRHRQPPTELLVLPGLRLVLGLRVLRAYQTFWFSSPGVRTGVGVFVCDRFLSTSRNSIAPVILK